MVIFDATMLILAVDPEAGKPNDPATGKPVEHVEHRISFLLAEVDKAKAKIGLPTPALSEAMVKSDLPPFQIVKTIQSLSVFQILPFDDKAAIELALMNRQALAMGDKKDGSQESWAKIKFDRQIVAIARVAQAEWIYTDDEGLKNACRKQNIKAVGLADMMLPPPVAQIELSFSPMATASPAAMTASDLDADEDQIDPKDA